MTVLVTGGARDFRSIAHAMARRDERVVVVDIVIDAALGRRAPLPLHGGDALSAAQPRAA
jgi:NAD(P)-dependent dehydrogenase (short-subunit alcohol dehydrogenase family)